MARKLLLAVMPLMLASAAACAADGETLAQVRLRGTLRCGVSEGISGFSARDASGRWSGLDVDFCRALAAAALGDAERVTFVPLKASARFAALRNGAVDLLSRNTTWTLARESVLGIQFAGVLFYDSQALMVPAARGVTAAAALAGATVCVEKDTSSETHVNDYFAARGTKVTLRVAESAAAAASDFFAGRCAAYTADASHLAAARLAAPGGARAYLILPEPIAKEPLGPAVRADDALWLTLTRWVLFSLIAAEERGVTQASLRAPMPDPTLKPLLDPGSEIDAALGVEPGWETRAIQSVGNYGELFERNLGAHSALNLERGLNRLWTQGGLMYAPPTR